jgi:hypothetical protein
MRKPRPRYSIHVIQENGAPDPVDAIRDHDRAVDAANNKALATGLEVRVWDTLKARCVYTAEASQ